MKTPVPLIAKGSGGEPFYVPTHHHGVANKLIIGPVGSGKSVLEGAMVCAATGIPDSRILWLDVDRSSWVLGHALGGAYLEPGDLDSPPLCPFIHLDEPEGLGLTFDWFSRLFARWPDIHLDEVQTADLTRALELAKSQGLRNMTLVADLIQDPRMRGVLRNYVSGGIWGHIFDGDDTFPDRKLTVYELRTLITYGQRAYAPAIELILNDALLKIRDNRPFFIFVDEARYMLSDEVSRRWLHDGIRTFRKFNAGIIMATQSLEDVAKSDDRDLLLESCPGKIFLPNPDARGEFSRELYLKLNLSAREVDIIANAAPQRQYYYHSSDGCRLFTLELGPIALRYIANTSRIGADGPIHDIGLSGAYRK
jgi:type IV secretion system protein TrbE